MGNVEIKIENILAEAAEDEKGRKAKLLVSDGPLRQTVIALTAGSELGEHNSPPAASIFMLRGRVRVTGQADTEVNDGDIVALTHQRHKVTALEDTVFLLTTVTSVPGRDSHGTLAGE